MFHKEISGYFVKKVESMINSGKLFRQTMLNCFHSLCAVLYFPHSGYGYLTRYVRLRISLHKGTVINFSNKDFVITFSLFYLISFEQNFKP